ncbi:hypothetical protein [Chamaesiphon sp. VAR_48_metabat_403]|uniref:hypothetical protein n=1 Tax=Chamaesiphon sp. VAR_48_metabat_403 TaxID=2964700 RepID=UPI00286E238D|nr:hypothetical protein [Chamaesiphon sp. VAR_48_metabat_403]
MVSIADAGNTWYPSLYIILQKGYTVEILEDDLADDNSLTFYSATKDDKKFIAWNFLSLLGLICIWENTGGDLINSIKESEELKSSIEIIEYKYEARSKE